MKWAYSLTGEGEHTMRIVVTEEGGGTASKEVTFNVIRFNSEFIADSADVRTAGATIESPVDGRLIIRDAEIENEIVDIARTHEIPLVGPNCLGILRPSVRLNASFAATPPPPPSW